MRKLIAMVAGAAYAAVVTTALAVPVFAADMTIKGEVVDIACATSKKEAGHGPGHAACAMVCAKKGSPVGVMTADAVYTISGDYTASNNAKLLDFIAKKVIVTGVVSEKDGEKTINVKSIKLAN